MSVWFMVSIILPVTRISGILSGGGRIGEYRFWKPILPTVDEKQWDVALHLPEDLQPHYHSTIPLPDRLPYLERLQNHLYHRKTDSKGYNKSLIRTWEAWKGRAITPPSRFHVLDGNNRRIQNGKITREGSICFAAFYPQMVQDLRRGKRWKTSWNGLRKHTTEEYPKRV